MKKAITSLFLIVIGLVLFATSVILLAPAGEVRAECTEDNSGQYCLLEPIPLGDGTAIFDKYDKDSTNAAGYINIVIKIFISVIGLLGVIMIVLGGIQYMTTDAISKKEGGREMITNSIFGLILALASWIILNDINPNLTIVNINPPETQLITVSADDDPPAGASNAAPGTAICKASQVSSSDITQAEIVQSAPWAGTGNMGDDSAPMPQTGVLHAERTYLNNNGVAINAANCPTVGASGCTSVFGYTKAQLDFIIAVRIAACGTTTNCDFKVTGGTECWLHGTHGPGKGKVDLSATASLNTFVNGSSNFPATSISISKTVGTTTASFLAEQAGQTGNTTNRHWHVSF